MGRLSFKTQPQLTDWRAVQAVWEAADELSLLDAGWLFDHFVPILTEQTDGPCFEGWTGLSFLAGVTSRLRLGLLVSSITYRHPAVLANMVATLDVASAGRVELGLGAGWFREEHDAYGIPFPPTIERLQRLEEACEVIHSLLTEPRSSLEGSFYRLQDARCEPKPVQRPRPPFVIGGGGERYTLRTAARWADDWNFPGTDPDELRHKRRVLERHCDEVGRDPSLIATSVHLFQSASPASIVEEARPLVAAGADHLIIYLRAPLNADALPGLAEALADLLA